MSIPGTWRAWSTGKAQALGPGRPNPPWLSAAHSLWGLTLASLLVPTSLWAASETAMCEVMKVIFTCSLPQGINAMMQWDPEFSCHGVRKNGLFVAWCVWLGDFGCPRPSASPSEVESSSISAHLQLLWPWRDNTSNMYNSKRHIWNLRVESTERQILPLNTRNCESGPAMEGCTLPLFQTVLDVEERSKKSPTL